MTIKDYTKCCLITIKDYNTEFNNRKLTIRNLLAIIRRGAAHDDLSKCPPGRLVALSLVQLMLVV
jgi:hypothetical protein